MYTYNWQGISLLLPPNKACPLEKKKKKEKQTQWVKFSYTLWLNNSNYE